MVVLAFAAVSLSMAADARGADKQIRPFVGFTFAGDTTFVPNISEGAGKIHATVGVSAAVLGDVFGVDVDFAHTPGFFQTGDPNDLILSSSITTLTGNIVVGPPKHRMEYVLRPYLVAGGGIMRVKAVDYFNVFPEVSQVKPAMDLGAGVVGFITNSVGVLWEVRRFQTLGGSGEAGISFGAESVSFWRATMAVAIRY
jgi:hypothetical protein